MVKWKKHRLFAEILGLTSKQAREIDFFLDYLSDRNIPHTLAKKATHNVFGIAISGAKYGERGALYAVSHIVLDQISNLRKRKNR